MVTFGPGSGTDIIARVIAEGLSEHLKVPVVVENREGAGGVVGIKAAMALPADGYTLVAIANTFLIAPQLFKTMPYDPTRDFTPLARVASMPMALVVGAQSPFKAMRDLIDYIKANPGKTSFATSGKGAQSHIEIEYVKQQLGLNSVDIPYKNTGGAITDTMGGLVTFYMTVPGFDAGSKTPFVVSTGTQCLKSLAVQLRQAFSNHLRVGGQGLPTGRCDEVSRLLEQDLRMISLQ